MERLWITLPALAPDYSGVCSAMFDLGGICVIHDASGCTGNYTGYDEPRWYGSSSKIFCSALREIDAVLGRDDKLIDNIVKAGEEIQPTMYTVIGSPVPMVIGSDMKGIAREIEDRTGLVAFGFDTNGLGLYNKGISMAMTELIKRFTKEVQEKIPRGINILGSNAIDFSANSNAKDLAETLEKWDFKVIGKLMMDASIEQIENLAKAEINLVVTESGLAAARLLKTKFDIPYVVGMPLGGSEDVRKMLEETLVDGQERILKDETIVGEQGHSEEDETVTNEQEQIRKDEILSDGQVQIQKDKTKKRAILIVAEQVLANSLRRAILHKKPDAKVTVGTLFGLNAKIAAKGDINITSEGRLIELIDSGKYTTIVGDPLLEDLLAEDDKMNIVKVPHVALSSKLYWDEMPRLLNKEETDKIIRQAV